MRSNSDRVQFLNLAASVQFFNLAASFLKHGRHDVKCKPRIAAFFAAAPGLL